MIFARVRSKRLWSWKYFSFISICEVDFFGGAGAMKAINDLMDVLDHSKSEFYRKRVRLEIVLEQHLFDFLALHDFRPPVSGCEGFWICDPKDVVVQTFANGGVIPLADIPDGQEIGGPMSDALRELSQETQAAKLRAEKAKYNSNEEVFRTNAILSREARENPTPPEDTAPKFTSTGPKEEKF